MKQTSGMAQAHLSRRKALGGLTALGTTIFSIACSAPQSTRRGSACRADQPDFACRVDGSQLVIDADGVPAHRVGNFPNPGCPFPIRTVPHHYALPRDPASEPSFTTIGWSEFGISITGVPFDPAGPYWQGDASLGWRFEVMSLVARPYLGLDFQNAHVQPNGAYHYHGLPIALLDLAGSARNEGRPALLGFAADGFPIYGPFGHAIADDRESPIVALRSAYRMRAGSRGAGPGGNFDGTFVEDYEYVHGMGDLDEANGRFGVTPEYAGGIYHYVITESFPFVPRLFRGRPDPSFVHGGDPGLAGVPPGLRGYRA